MNPFAHAQVRQSSEAEFDALEKLAERLHGFDHETSLEWLDGFLCALAAGPHVPPVDDWLPAISKQNFARVFADPADHAQALRCLQTRLKILCEQLSPEALMADLEALRLYPIVMEWTEEERQNLVDSGQVAADDAAYLSMSGAEWALGFLDAVTAFDPLWEWTPLAQADEELANTQLQLLDQVTLLLAGPGTQEREALLTQYYPEGEPTRDQMLNEALYAVQDLRLTWLDRAPKPATRRVEAVPGRNDPCHCGSGKKFKKCHGATA